MEFARQFFSFNSDDGYNYCQVENCNGKIKGDHHGNLEAHIRRFHKEAYAAIDNEKSETQTTKRQRSKSLSVVLDIEDLKNACVEMVTVNGRPFQSINDSGFRKILDPLLEALPTDQTITSDNIGILVSLRAKEVRTSIRNEISGRLVSLKVDAATRHDRGFLGINIQFAENGKIHVRTLGIIELFERHSAEYLQTVIQKVLEEYDIDISNIYSFTSDNGANMVKLGKLLLEHQVTTINEEEVEDKDDDNITNDNENEDDVPVEDENDELFEELGSCQLTNGTSLISNIPCAAHTLQLAVGDALKVVGSTGKVIAKARKVAKVLRTPTMRKIVLLSNPKARKTKLDVATRWNATADMLESLLELKKFCQEFSSTHKDLEMTEHEWQEIEDYLKSLAPARQATIRLQDEQLTLGSFYGIWEECKCDTELVPTKLARELLKAMKKREEKLMKNDALLASIYLDPRFLPLLPTHYYPDAIKKLESIWEALERLENSSRGFQLNAPTHVRNSQGTNQPSKGGSGVSNNFRQILDRAVAARVVKPSGISDIRRYLEDYGSSFEPIDPTTDILQYWEARKNTMPQLYRLATVVHAAPATQVTVERLFSGLHFIFSDLRTNMKDEMLDDILVVRSNRQNTRNSRGEVKTSRRQRRRTESDLGSSESSGTSTPTDPDVTSRNLAEYLKDTFDRVEENGNSSRTAHFSQF